MPVEPPAFPPAGPAWLAAMRAAPRRKRFWLLALVLLYLLAGFFVLPPLARRQIVETLGATLDRPVTLDGVRVNPLTLAVELRGLRVTEKGGAPLLACDRLYARLSPASLWRWAWGVAELRLDGVKVAYVRYGAGDDTVSRLLAAMDKAAGPPPPTDATKGRGAPAEGAGPRWFIRHLRLVGAGATVADRLVPGSFHTVIGPVDAQLDDLSDLPDDGPPPSSGGGGADHLRVGLEGGAWLDWTARSSLAPLASNGHLTVRGPLLPLLARYAAAGSGLTLPAGDAALDIDYRLGAAPTGGLTLAVADGALTLSHVAVRAGGGEEPVLTLPAVRLSGAHLEWPARTAGAEALTFDDPALSVWRTADGAFGPALSLAASPPPPASSVATPMAPPPPANAGGVPPWAWSLGHLVIKGGRVTAQDRVLGPAGPAGLVLAPLDLAVDGLSSRAGVPATLTLATGVAPLPGKEPGIASPGRMELKGRVWLPPQPRLEARLTLADLPLALAQPYVRRLIRLHVAGGRLEGAADLRFDPAAGLEARGDAAVRGFKLQDATDGATLAAWDRLAVDHFHYRQAANDLQIAQITLAAPYLRLQVAADQSTNFGDLREKDTSVQPTAASSAPAGPPASAERPMRVGVGRMVINAGAVDYGDASLPLPFSAHVTALHGHVAALTTGDGSPARLSLSGQVGDYGQVAIRGGVTVGDPSRDTHVDTLFRNIEFPGLSPYTLKFAGRRVAKGRLDVDLDYAIDHGHLKGANQVVIRDIELGEKVAVPGALDLPLDLAIALLKDDEGRIKVDLPVSGDVNDPRFDIGAVVGRAAADLLGNLVTAPFRVLAGLLGGGAPQLDHIDFAPGHADLAPPEREKIQTLAQALRQRPRLGLVVAGVVDPKADRARLQARALDARMAQSLGDHATVGRQRRFLEGLFIQRLGAAPLAALRQTFASATVPSTPSSASGRTGGPPPDGRPSAELDEGGYVAALRQRLAATEPVDDQALAALAQARAQAVIAALSGALGAGGPSATPSAVTAPMAGVSGRIRLGGEKAVSVDDEGLVRLMLEAISVDTAGADAAGGR